MRNFLLFVGIITLSITIQNACQKNLPDCQSEPDPYSTTKCLSYHKNGKLRIEGEFEKGSKHGSWTWYNDRGSLIAKGDYLNGLREGDWEIYYPKNGALEEKGAFRAGNRTGNWLQFHENGAKKAKGEYKNGKPHGLWEYFFSNGYPEKKGIYKDGISIEKWN